MEKVKEVTLNIDDLKVIGNHLVKECGLDALDMLELITKIEDRKGVVLDI